MIFKGYIRFSKEHRLDFFINLFVLTSFLIALLFFENKFEILTLLSLCIFIPFSFLLIKKIEFNILKFNDEVFKSIFNSFPLMIYSLLGYLLLNIDLYVFEYWDKVDFYANFAVSNKFFLNITMIPVILANYRISFLSEKEETRESIYREFLGLGIVLAFISFVLSDFFIDLLGHGKILLTVNEKLLFSLMIFLRTINTYYGLRVLMALNNWVRLYTILIILTIHLSLLFVFIYYFDWRGALYALVASSFLFVVLNFIVLKRNGNSRKNNLLH
ncbi:hypothetical protein [Tenacibaculum sp. MEBiC06402]|uniref:hypothetical protein n=1 Tax=Tenacibaculum sp. MEBiC06402 TaxID=3412023 RepID=UPI003BAAA92D